MCGGRVRGPGGGKGGPHPLQPPLRCPCSQGCVLALTVQSPEADKKTSAATGFHCAAYTQYVCSAKVRKLPGASTFHSCRQRVGGERGEWVGAGGVAARGGVICC